MIRILALTLSFLAWQALSASGGQVAPDERGKVDQVVQAYVLRHSGEANEHITYIAKIAALKDASPGQVVVYLNSPGFCGSGGCTMLVLNPDRSSYRVISKTTIVHPPIRLLDSKSHGWHDLAVAVAGGGTKEYESRLSFNGRTYPGNPSVPPAQRLYGSAPGVVLIPADREMSQPRYVHTAGAQLVDASGHPLILRGTSLGNWLVREGYMFHFEGGPTSAREIEALTNELLGPEAAKKFWQEYVDRYITRDDIQFLKRTGMNSIRVPIQYKYFQADDAEGFKLLDRVVEWSGETGIYVIIDMHCAPGGQTGANIDDSWGYPWLYDSPEAQQQTISAWKRIAAHYRNSETVLGYDLLNEPIPHFPELKKYNPQLEPLYKRIVAAIREVDRNHVVILGGAQWDTNFSVFGPPFDKNAMYTFHKYWMPPEQKEIQAYVDFRDKYHVPIWLGESGENEDAWIAQFRELLEKNRIGWTFWPYKKMDSPRSVVSFARPPYWDEIVAFAKMKEGMGDTQKRIAKRPPQEHINAAFAGLLDNISFAKCRVNEGYVKALGLSLPK